MDREQKNIEYLLKYLNGDLSGEEAHALELEIEENPFLKDALDGLSENPNQQEIRSTLTLLQKNLQHQVEHRKRRRPKIIKPSVNFWILTLIVLIILLAAGLMFRAFIP